MKGSKFVVLLFCAVYAFNGCVKNAADGKIPVTTSSDEARKEFLQGRSIAEKLLITKSIGHFDKAIALDPGFASAYLARANASFTGTDFFANLKNAVAASDKVSEGERLLIQATEANANGNTVKQKEYLEKLVQLFPNDERAHFALGGYYFGVQEYTQAIEHYNKSIAIDPNYSLVYNMLGYAYRQVDNFPDAEKAFKKYTELIPGDPNPYDSYAELLMKMGRFDESIANYQKALSNDSSFVSSRIGLAADYLYKGMADRASAELEKVSSMVHTDGDLRAAYFAQMVVDADAGKWDRALLQLDKQYALGEKVNDVAAMSADLGFKGNILLEMGKPDEAMKAFEKSLQVVTASDLSKEIKENAQRAHHYNLALVAIARKDLKTAKAESAEFAKGAEGAKSVNQMRLAHQLSGSISMAEKNLDAAISELMQANLQNPYDLYRLALAYHEKGDHAKAKEYSQKAAHFYGLPALNYAFVRTKAEKLLASK